MHSRVHHCNVKETSRSIGGFTGSVMTGRCLSAMGMHSPGFRVPANSVLYTCCGELSSALSVKAIMGNGFARERDFTCSRSGSLANGLRGIQATLRTVPRCRCQNSITNREMGPRVSLVSTSGSNGARRITRRRERRRSRCIPCQEKEWSIRYGRYVNAFLTLLFLFFCRHWLLQAINGPVNVTIGVCTSTVS